MANNKTSPLPADELARVGREVLSWVNGYPDVPDGVDWIRYEYLPTDSPAMALSVIQGTNIVARYILGGYRAEYRFKLVYRLKPGTSVDKRLQADELLNGIGAWAEDNPPEITGSTVRSVEVTAASALFAMYENGDEDHQILMKITYEVNI